MGQLLDILTAPGALASLRWQWLRDSPTGPSDLADVAGLTEGFAPLASLESSLDESLMGAGIVLLHARVPTPENWPGSGEAVPLGGMALIGPSGELLQIVWLYPALRRDVRAVTVTIQAMTGS